MIPLLLSEIAHMTKGTLIGEDKTIHQINTDSRSLNTDDVFLALKGENFDGHKFSQQAEKLLCSALIVEAEQSVNISQVVVDNTRVALGQIGAYVKEQP